MMLLLSSSSEILPFSNLIDLSAHAVYNILCIRSMEASSSAMDLAQLRSSCNHISRKLFLALILEFVLKTCPCIHRNSPYLYLHRHMVCSVRKKYRHLHYQMKASVSALLRLSLYNPFSSGALYHPASADFLPQYIYHLYNCIRPSHRQSP